MLLFDLSTQATVKVYGTSIYYMGSLTITNPDASHIHTSIPDFPHPISIIPQTTAQSTQKL
jgi:hypothetical protein